METTFPSDPVDNRGNSWGKKTQLNVEKLFSYVFGVPRVEWTGFGESSMEIEIQETAVNWSGLLFEAGNNGRLLRLRVGPCNYDIEMEVGLLVSGK